MAPTEPQTLPLGGADSLAKQGLRARLDEARRRTVALVAPVSVADLERVHNRLLSPLVWDLGHIAAFEDLWLCQHAGGLEPLRPDLMEVYDATLTPRRDRGRLPFLRHAEAVAFMQAVRERALDVLARSELTSELERDGFVWEMLIAHEQQHNETMLQALALADPGVYVPPRRALPAAPAREPGEMALFAGGEFDIGATADGFAYDNERPRHTVRLRAFAIDRAPVTNAAYAEFVDAGGYSRREWWSDEGWRWRCRAGARRPLHWTADGRIRRFDRLQAAEPHEPVMHVSWYEADAYARAQGKRLPTEAEWEAAAGAGRYPWGDDPPGAEHANLDQLAFGPAAVGAYPAGATENGIVGLIGDAWEWTASDLTAYPGFRAYPYEQYSKIFFGASYKVLRGGSWATRPSVIRTSFRNWDFPDRRQIFCGFRCAVSA